MDAAAQLQLQTQHIRNKTASCPLWYHRHFVDRAQQYTQPGTYRQQEN
jgi:hypothetical protein